MATEVVKIIDPDNGGGTHYTSLDAWEDALGGTTTGHLPNDDQIAVAQCRNSSGGTDTTAVSITGWTTDATRYIKIEAYTGYRHTGVWDASKYHIATTDINTFVINEDYVRLDGIQIYLTTTGDVYRSIYVDNTLANNLIWLSNLIIKGAVTGTGGAQGIRVADSDAIVKIWNCVIYNFISASDPTDSAFIGIELNASVSIDIWNCTVNDCRRGIVRGASGGTVTAVNCLVFENDDDFTGTIAMTYCASDDDHTGDSATNKIISAAPDQSGDDYAALVVDADGRDYNITDVSSKLVGNGTDDPGGATQDDTDIAGNARTSTWDIGAFELVGAPPVGMAGAMTTNTGYWGW